MYVLVCSINILTRHSHPNPVLQLMIVIGASTTFVVGTALEWRILALTGIIPCLIQLLGLNFICESPRWLIPITAVSAFLVDNCGRKPLLLASSTGTFLGCFIAAISFLMKEHNLLQQWVPLLVLSGLLIFVGSFAIGMGAVPWVLLSEIFPINVKGAAGSLVNLEHWFGAWAVSYTFNFLMDWSPSGVCAASIIFVNKVVPETKGRTLEEIQASINSSSSQLLSFPN
ncbi:hypothetical protein GOBAR_DD33898 [Gossypium barbadense]|nr:hypothetical protein GOBAR_DD33898 [Gossypium barbadense]